jgi:hypothetical protein
MQHEGVPTSRKVAVQRSFTYRVAATIPLLVLTSILTWVDAPIRTKSFPEVEWCVGIEGTARHRAIVNRNVNKPEQS